MKVIIVGATSGIGRALAIRMSNAGYTIGITGRREELLDSLAAELSGECFKSVFDVADMHAAETAFNKLLADMGSVDIVVYNAGVGSLDLELPLAKDLHTIAVNVTGFTVVVNSAFQYFRNRRKGHIVGISSVAALRGGKAAAYHASKAYMSSYLEGLALVSAAQNLHLSVTDVRPGFVDTAMIQAADLFWVAPVDKAAAQIFTAIEQKRRCVYVTKRWRMLAILLPLLPFSLLRRIV